MNINCGNAKPQNRDVRLHVKSQGQVYLYNTFQTTELTKVLYIKSV